MQKSLGEWGICSHGNGGNTYWLPPGDSCGVSNTYLVTVGKAYVCSNGSGGGGSLPTCAKDQILQYNGTTWVCATLPSGSLPTCTEGQILKYTGGKWVCADSGAGGTGCQWNYVNKFIDKSTTMLNPIPTGVCYWKNDNGTPAGWIAQNGYGWYCAFHSTSNYFAYNNGLGQADGGQTTIPANQKGYWYRSCDGGGGSLPTCAKDQILKYNGTNWVCAADNTGASLPTCSEGQILQYTGGQWKCANMPTWQSPNPLPELFGGMYGYGDGTCKYPHPQTKQCTCPSGYTDQTILGMYNVDYEVHYCRKDNDGVTKSLYLFGGMFGYGDSGSGNCKYPNPHTNKCTCPSGYTEKATLGTTNTDWGLYYCYKTNDGSQTLDALWWMFGYSYNLCSYPNPHTAGCNCLTGYTARTTFGTTNTDYPLGYCYKAP